MNVSYSLKRFTIAYADGGPRVQFVVQAPGGGGGSFDGEHNDLDGRDTADAHPISAITGLQDALDNAGGVADDDPRLSDSRTPSGGAGGFLSGNYPNPGVNTEALQDAVGAMAGTGLEYDDTGGVLNVTATGVELGETDSTAYRGDRGKTAYDHSQTSGNPHGTAAGDITSGTFDAARIPNLDASKIATGTVAQARLGSGSSGAGTKFLADDQTYKTVTAGSSGLGMANNNIHMRYVAPGLARVAFAEPIVTLANGTTYYFGPYETATDLSVDRIQLKVQAITGTANVRVAFIPLAPSTWQPASLAYALAELTYDSTGEKTATFTAQTILAGAYWVGVRADNSLALSGMRMMPRVGWRGQEEGFVTFLHCEVSEAYGAFSSTPTAWTTAVKVSSSGIAGSAIPITWGLT